MHESYSVITNRYRSIFPFLSRVGGRTKGRALILGGLVISVFLFTYMNVFISLVDQWWSNDMYYHAFFIPCISLYLIWARRHKLAQLHAQPNYIGGLLILGAGFLMLLLGHAGSVQLIQELSLIPTVAGVVLLIFGTRFFLVLCFPIAYLLFMIPFWEYITDRLHWPFQIFSATLGARLLQLVGIPVHQESIYIELPRIILEVAEGCSGVNYLIAVMALGIPLAYLFLDGWRRRTVLVCFAVGVAMFSNVLRVFFVGLLTYYGIGGDIHGPYHVLQGLFVSVIGYGAIFGGLQVLARPSSGTAFEEAKRPLGSTTHQDAPIGQNKKARFAALLVSGLMLVVGVYLHTLSKSAPVLLMNNLGELPLRIGQWEGENAVIIDNPYSDLRADRELSRSYSNAKGQVVHFYVGYFETQTQNKELIHQRSRVFFKNVSGAAVRVNDEKFVEVNKVLSGEGNRRRLSLVWYDFNGRVITDPYLAKFYTSWSGLTRRQTNGAVIWVSSEITEKVSQDDAFSNASDFVQQVFPLLTDYLPRHES